MTRLNWYTTDHRVQRAYVTDNLILAIMGGDLMVEGGYTNERVVLLSCATDADAMTAAEDLIEAIITLHGAPPMPSPRDAAFNRTCIRNVLRRFPGITGKEVAAYLGLTATTVSRHIRAIRAEWNPKEPTDA